MSGQRNHDKIPNTSDATAELLVLGPYTKTAGAAYGVWYTGAPVAGCPRVAMLPEAGSANHLAPSHHHLPSGETAPGRGASMLTAAD
jgi:hypothetical protein